MLKMIIQQQANQNFSEIWAAYNIKIRTAIFKPCHITFQTNLSLPGNLTMTLNDFFFFLKRQTSPIVC